MEREKCKLIDNNNSYELEKKLKSDDSSREKFSSAAERVRRLASEKKIISGRLLDCNLNEKPARSRTQSEKREKNPSDVRENDAKERKKITPRTLDFEKSPRSRDESANPETKTTESFESLESLTRNLEQFISEKKMIDAGVEHSSLNRMMALCNLKAGDEQKAIENLTQSHSVFLHASIFHRYQKTEVRNRFYAPQAAGLKPKHMKFYLESTNVGDSLKDKLSQLPQEWYVIQLTSQYENSSSVSLNSAQVNSMRPVHVTILPTGANIIDPICITLPGLETRDYDGVREIVKIVKNNKDDLETHYSANAHYWAMRAKQNSSMKVATMVLEESWLREWRILLVADPLEDSRLVKEMRAMIDKLIADDLSIVNISPRSRWLLRKIATSACYLSKAEIARAVLYVVRNNKKLATNIIFSIYGKLTNVNDLRAEKRKSLILIVDESLDHIPFESMSFLTNHPVTRFPSFHVAYAMFKEHEDTIVKGCKVVKISNELGSFIVNPSGDLRKTELRMQLFIDYWLRNWKGTYNIKPDETSFGKVLENHDILMYVGHGSGIQYIPGNHIEKLRVRALALLFGCSSLKLTLTGGRFSPMGVCHRYLTACSPCVMGTLWEITDGDIDKLTTRFISDWVPSTASRPWSDVDLNKWAAGKLTFTTSSTGKDNSKTEPEMLRAIANSKEICTQHMTAAAVIVRGLPIRLE